MLHTLHANIALHHHFCSINLHNYKSYIDRKCFIKLAALVPANLFFFEFAMTIPEF